MSVHQHHRALAAAILAFTVPLSLYAQSPAGDKYSAPASAAPTLAEVLSHDALRPFGITESLSEKGSDPLWRGQKRNANDSPPKGQTPFRIGSETRPLDERPQATAMREALQERLRQRMQSRLKALPAEIASRRDGDSRRHLTPAPLHADSVDLKRQRSSWLALIAGDYAQAAAHLHDALLRGGAATVAQLHQLAGSEQAYNRGFGALAEVAETGKAEQFLFAYHAALRGETLLARAALKRLDQQSPPIHLDPIVRFRLQQLLD